MRISGQFPNPVDAEDYVINYLGRFGFTFERIDENIPGEKPEGYILIDGQRVGLIEVKCISLKKIAKGSVGESFSINDVIRASIHKAKKQLGNIPESLAKVVVLVADCLIFDDLEFIQGVFGRAFMSQDEQGDSTDGLLGFTKEYSNSNKFKDNLLSGVIALLPQKDNGTIAWLIKNNENNFSKEFLEKIPFSLIFEYSMKDTIINLIKTVR